MFAVQPQPATDLPRFTEGVLVAVPAFNEDRYIGSVVLKLRARGYAVLVVDDGSTDDTAQVAEGAGAQVVRHAQNSGKAAAVRTAFQHARAVGASALVLLDGDSQHDPADVERLIEPVLAGTADMVVGSRFVGVRNRIPRWRVVGQHAMTLATNMGSGVALTDSQSGFRAFSARALEAMRFHRAGFSVESEMQFEARQAGLSVLEVPIRVHYDLPNKRNPVGQGLTVLEGLLRLVAQHRPLLFFTAPGVLLLLSGIALGYGVVRIYEASLQLAVGYALITVLLSVVGILSIFVGIMLHTMRALVLDLERRQ